MALHSHVKVWVHLIWGTYRHERILDGELKPKIFNHLINYATEEIGIVIDKLNIQPEHIHCLLQLHAETTISQVAKLLKGESSRWINENRFIMKRFRWQRGYGAFSVSASQLNTVKKYIHNQDRHHTRKSFTNEYNEWAKKYGISNKTLKNR